MILEFLSAGLLLALGLAGYLGWRLWQEQRESTAAKEALSHSQAQLAALEGQRRQLVFYLQGINLVDTHGLCVVDSNLKVLWLNDTMQLFWGKEVSEGVFLSELSLDETILETVRISFRDAALHEVQYHDEKGSYHVRMRRILGGPGAMVALRVRDVTELQRLGRARRDFVANISHDLRTPITTIGVLVDALQDEAAHSSKQRAKLLNAIVDQTAALKQLAQELMDLSLIESGRMPLRLVEVSAAQLLQDAREQMGAQGERKHIKILIEAPSPDLRALADHDHIRRVLQNLIHNAIKFSPEESKVVIGAKAKDGDVYFWVRDWGGGISGEEQKRIFERFYKADATRSSGGTGLGLAIARHIIEGHGGRIGVESAVGTGSTFWFTLIRGDY